MNTDRLAKLRRAEGGRLAAVAEVLLVSLKMGLTSFGGPTAHIGYFHNEYIRRRKWLDEQGYAELVALCQMLPGPASSQIGIGIGMQRAGLSGGVAAWLGFTLPSALAMAALAIWLQGYDVAGAGWLHGLKLVAVAIVAHAVLGMGQKLAAGGAKATLAVLAAAIALFWQAPYSQVVLIIAAGTIGAIWFQRAASPDGASGLSIPVSRVFAGSCLALFALLLFALPLLRQLSDAEWLALVDSYYRSGSLVFGGGHVVLPLLEREVVPTGWASPEDFLAGYGAAQAVPGPLFTFAAYLGALSGGAAGAAIAIGAIFLPAFLLVAGALPFWSALREQPRLQGAIAGINAAVVGLLIAALYNPLWTTTVHAPADFVAVLLLFAMLSFWKLPPWIVVIAGAAGGSLLALL